MQNNLHWMASMVVSWDIWGVDKDWSRFEWHAMSTGKWMDLLRCVTPYLLHPIFLPSFLPSHYFALHNLPLCYVSWPSRRFDSIFVHCIVPPPFSWPRHPKGSDKHVSQHGQLIAVENDKDNNGIPATSSFCLLLESFSHNLKKPESWLVV